MIRRRFEVAVHSSAAAPPDGTSKPDKLAEQGILTRDSLAWMAAAHPKPPAADYHIDNAEIRSNATDNAHAEHRARLEKLRAEFRNRSAKGRQDFKTAQHYRKHQHER